MQIFIKISQYFKKISKDFLKLSSISDFLQKFHDISSYSLQNFSRFLIQTLRKISTLQLPQSFFFLQNFLNVLQVFSKVFENFSSKFPKGSSLKFLTKYSQKFFENVLRFFSLLLRNISKFSTKFLQIQFFWNFHHNSLNFLYFLQVSL